jgi:hypothetical protein
MTLPHGMDYDQIRAKEGDTMPDNDNNSKRTDSFWETIGEKDIEINDYKVDDLRKIASKLDISGSHDMHKEELVDTINKTRHNVENKEAA